MVNTFEKYPPRRPAGMLWKKSLGFFHNSHCTVPTRHFVKATLEFFHNLPLPMLSGCFVKETPLFFHNSPPKVPSRHFVKETPLFFHNLLSDVPIKNLSHTSRVLLQIACSYNQHVPNYILGDLFEGL